MFVQVENNSERITFDDVEKVIFHSDNENIEFNVLEAIAYDKHYNSFTLVRTSSETTFNNSYRIVTVIQ